MTLRLAIIADDLTGALDAAAAFADVPGGVVVATSPDALLQALDSSPGVVAVSTRSRECPPGRARDAVASVLSQLPEGTRLFKKIDSRLKGNIEAELDPFEVSVLHCAPGIPEFDRIVRDGVLSGFGLAEPIDIALRLGRHAGRASIPDTLSMQDMYNALAATGPQTLLVGARSLATALAGQLSLGRRTLSLPMERPACIAIGSFDPITRAQLDHLLTALPDVCHLPAPSGNCPAPESVQLPESVHVSMPGPGSNADSLYLLQIVPGMPQGAADMAERFANTSLPFLQTAHTLVLSGGATAEAVLDALDCPVLSLQGEVLPGLPLCHAGNRAIVTKSGGFGAPDTLTRLFSLDLSE